ncbi:hypothetical protein C8F04DRAFT_1267870 [Mycena alexandri]|uniref:Uncharacterized protein n=1 Tax=Mycena alexandri TaxID=1745969 RepID=A0AAD6WZG4_9AGAR|nr:hypothetical protein C8F04DRAFT_1267870 [Mycena alexandri]
MPAGWVVPTPVVRGCAAPSASAPAPAAAPVAAPVAAPIGPRTGSCPSNPSCKNQQVGEQPYLAICGAIERLSQPPSRPSSVALYWTLLLHRRPPAHPAQPQSRLLRVYVGGQLDVERSLFPVVVLAGVVVISSPGAGYDTDFFYGDDTGEESGPESTQTRFWAVRGLSMMFSDVDSAFDALRQNMDRLKYMEVRMSTSLSELRRFAATPSLFPVSHIRIVAIIAIVAIVAIITATIITDSLGITYTFSPLAQSWTPT